MILSNAPQGRLKLKVADQIRYGQTNSRSNRATVSKMKQISLFNSGLGGGWGDIRERGGR